MPNPAPPKCPECSPLPWAVDDAWPENVHDANGRFLFGVDAPYNRDVEWWLAAFIVAAANATQEKDKRHE